MPLITIMTMEIMIMAIAMTDRRDWHSDPIAGDTVIDASYRNTQNVRRFFKAAIGERFKFDRPFMAWMKSHQGSTMADHVAEWLRREAAQ